MYACHGYGVHLWTLCKDVMKDGWKWLTNLGSQHCSIGWCFISVSFHLHATSDSCNGFSGKLTCNIKQTQTAFWSLKYIWLQISMLNPHTTMCVWMVYMLEDRTKCQFCPFGQATFLTVFLSRLQLGYILSYYLSCVTAVHIRGSSWHYTLYK